MKLFVTFILHLLKRFTIENLSWFCIVTILVFHFCSFTSILFLWLYKAFYIFRDKLLYLEGQILLYEIVCGSYHAEIVIGCKADGFNLLDKIVSHYCVLIDVKLVHFQTRDFCFIPRALFIRLSSDHSHFIKYAFEVLYRYLILCNGKFAASCVVIDFKFKLI